MTFACLRLALAIGASRRGRVKSELALVAIVIVRSIGSTTLNAQLERATFTATFDWLTLLWRRLRRKRCKTLPALRAGVSIVGIASVTLMLNT